MKPRGRLCGEKFQTNGNLIIYIYVSALPCLCCTFIDVVSQGCRALLIYAVVSGCQPNPRGSTAQWLRRDMCCSWSTLQPSTLPENTWECKAQILHPLRHLGKALFSSMGISRWCNRAVHKAGQFQGRSGDQIGCWDWLDVSLTWMWRSLWGSL